MIDQMEDLAKRRDQYLKRAEEADKMAITAHGQVAQDTFRSIADSWRQLAERVSRSIKS